MPQKPPWYESNLLWGPLGIGAGIVLAVVAAMKHDLRWLLLVAWACFASSAYIGIRAAKLTRPRMLLANTIGTIIIAIALLCLNQWLPAPRPQQGGSTTSPTTPTSPPAQAVPTRQVEESFANIYKEYGTSLGQPLGDHQVIRAVYQVRHEYATLIWMADPLKFYVLQNDKTWHEEAETSFPPVPYGKAPWYSDKDLKRMFRPPQGFGPPFGSIAYHWSKEPKRWKRMIGWREWQCNFPFNTVQYQDFEHGRVIGTLRFRPSDDAGEVFVLLDDQTWRSGYSTLRVNSDPCNVP